MNGQGMAEVRATPKTSPYTGEKEDEKWQIR
jgi:hypothetical protein